MFDFITLNYDCILNVLYTLNKLALPHQDQGCVSQKHCMLVSWSLVHWWQWVYNRLMLLGNAAQSDYAVTRVKYLICFFIDTLLKWLDTLSAFSSTWRQASTTSIESYFDPWPLNRHKVASTKSLSKHNGTVRWYFRRCQRKYNFLP